MTNEEIRAVCSRAVSLSSDVEDESLRNTAFGVILANLLHASSGVPSLSGNAVNPPAKSNSKTKSRRRGGLTSRLQGLTDAGFFAEPRAIADIAAELKVSGWNHEPKEISARLIELTRAQRLRRANSSSGMLYSNW